MHQMLREHIEKIVPLTDDEFAFVQQHFTWQTRKKHQFLIQAGAPVRYAYYVVSGLLRLVFTDDRGKQHILSFAMEDWWESDFQAFYAQANATLSLDCLEDTAVLCLSLTGYQTVCANLPKMERFFLAKSVAGYMASQRRLLSLLTTRPSERYTQLLSQYPALIQRVPKTLLASYLGVSRETLSRLSS